MGCCLPCFRRSQEYTPIPDIVQNASSSDPTSLELSNAVHVQHPAPAFSSSPSHDGSEPSFEASMLRGFDLEAPPFIVSEVGHKFMCDSTYVRKYVWVSKTPPFSIHVSSHKETRKAHQEASIGDIVTVVAGVPKKYTPPDDMESAETAKKQLKMLLDLCLTIDFKGKGGIDLKFRSKTERDKWYEVLTQWTRDSSQKC